MLHINYLDMEMKAKWHFRFTVITELIKMQYYKNILSKTTPETQLFSFKVS